MEFLDIPMVVLFITRQTRRYQGDPIHHPPAALCHINSFVSRDWFTFSFPSWALVIAERPTSPPTIKWRHRSICRVAGSLLNPLWRTRLAHIWIANGSSESKWSKTNNYLEPTSGARCCCRDCCFLYLHTFGIVLDVNNNNACIRRGRPNGREYTANDLGQHSTRVAFFLFILLIIKHGFGVFLLAYFSHCWANDTVRLSMLCLSLSIREKLER